eukprot:13978448-Heterocapsa_arctica.AAC.1
MSDSENWAGVFGAPSTAPPSEVPSSATFALAGSDAYKTGSEGSDPAPAKTPLRALPALVPNPLASPQSDTDFCTELLRKSERELG